MKAAFLISLITFMAFSGSTELHAAVADADERSLDVSLDLLKSASDEAFLKAAARENLAEIALAKLAIQKSSSPDVHHLARYLIQEHTTAQRQLETVATRRDVRLPATMGRAHDAVEQQLSRLNGPAFDEGYARHLQLDQQKVLSDHQTIARDGADPDVRRYASAQVTELEQNLAMVQQLAGSAAANGATNGPIETSARHGLSSR